jgi:thiol:disulfide interchange protein DsbD
VGCFGWLLALLVPTAGPAWTDPADDPFALANKAAPQPAPAQADRPGDPFAADNQAQPPAAQKADDLLTREVTRRIAFQARVEPPSARPGQTVRLTITGKPKDGNHIFPLTQRTPDTDKSQSARIEYGPNPVLRPLWPVSESPPEFKREADGKVYLEHVKEFTWSQDLLVLPDAPPGPQRLALTIKLQVCDAHSCTRPGSPYPPLEVVVDVLAGDKVPLSPELQRRLAAPPPEVEVVPVPGAFAAAEGGGGTHSLAGLLIASVGAAIAMLFTPCVFPMIPITVSFFLKQSEKAHHNAPLMAGVYSVTIIVVLAAAVLVLGEGIVWLANDPWMNLGLGLLLVFFALSLFGMYEIELPHGLARFTSAYEGKGGYVGALFMALTFTITSFTCTGPFLGPLLVAVKEYQLSFGERALGAAVYATTFAAPFFVLALFPGLLKALPKSGGWLNAVKVVMGFLELAAALKFLANFDLAKNPGNPLLLNYETVLCAWIALSVACGLYLLGAYRLPHDTPLDHLGVVRMLLASVFFVLAVYMVPALWRVTPQGLVGEGLVAFLPLDTRSVPLSAGGGSAELSWLRDYEQAWQLAKEKDRLIFIDFTGQNCTNCRYNEKNVFPKPEVHQELEKYVRVQLYTDFVPTAGLTQAEAESQAARNSSWQRGTFQDVTNPLYAVLKPDKDRPIVDGPDGPRLSGAVLGVRKGLISQDKLPDFVEFLRGPQRQAGARGRAEEKSPAPAAEARARR